MQARQSTMKREQVNWRLPEKIIAVWTHTVGCMHDVSHPNTADIVTIFRSNANSFALLIIRDVCGVVNLEDSSIRIGVDVGEPFGYALVRRHEERVAIHLIVN